MNSMVSGQKGDGMTQEYLPTAVARVPYILSVSNGLRCVLEEKDPIERSAEYVDAHLWIERDRATQAIVACTFRQPGMFFQELHDRGFIQEGGESDVIAWWRLFETIRSRLQLRGRMENLYAFLEETLSCSGLKLTSKEWLPYIAGRAQPSAHSSQTTLKSAPPRRPIRSRSEVA